MGALDAPVLDRLAKVLSFVRISGKNGKKLKRKDKLRMLEAMDQAQLGGHANGGSAAHQANGDSAQPPLPTCALPATPTPECVIEQPIVDFPGYGWLWTCSMCSC